MDQHCPYSASRDYLSTELTPLSIATDDSTKKVLDSLGKFKTSQTVSQIKGRPYRSNASDELPDPSLNHARQEAKTSYRKNSTSHKDTAAKARRLKNSHSTSVRHTDNRAARECKTTGSSTTSHRSTSDYPRCSSTGSSQRPSSSKQTGSSDLCGSHHVSKSPKKESVDENLSGKNDSLNKRQHIDSNNKSKRNRQQISSVDQSDQSDRTSGQYKCEQDELQKHIDELKKEIEQQKSKIKEVVSRVGDVSLKIETKNESVLASSSSQRTRTESSKYEGKDDRVSHKSTDYRLKASEKKSKFNEMASRKGNASIKSDRKKKSILASLSSHRTKTEPSKHKNKDDKVPNKSENHHKNASQEPQKSTSRDSSRHQRRNFDKSCKSQIGSLGHRMPGSDRNTRSRSPRGLSHSHGYNSAQSQSQNYNQSPACLSPRSRSISRRSQGHRSRSCRSQSCNTESHRSGSQSHNRKAGSRSRNIPDHVSRDKPHKKWESERAQESPRLNSHHGHSHNKPLVGKKIKSQSRSRSPHYKSNHRSVDRVADDSRKAMNKYMSNRHSPTIVRSRSQDPPEESSISRRSPSSFCSFELDWPRSPCQPGMNLRAKGDCISPMSQLFASDEAKLYKNVGVPVRKVVQKRTGDEASGKLSKDRCLPSILGPRLLVKRDAQHNSVVSIWAERTIDCFEVIRPIGRGAYGQVYKAADKDKNLLVAVKRITASSKHGFPLSAVREMTCLRLLDHPNIIRLLEIVRDTSSKESAEITGMYYFVYEYVAHDLEGLIESNLVKLSPDNISCIMTQLLNGLDYCHSHCLVHHNIKSSNILINYRGELKLTQFGMSRILHDASQKERSYTTTVTSLWYRSPELLLGSDLYETTVDMWSCGCILGEMFLQKPLFPGRDDLHQLHLISILCGSMNAAVWPEVTLLPLYYTVKSRAQQPRRLREDFGFLPVAALDLLDVLLTLDPKKRCSAAEALRMDWLRDINLQKLPPIHLPKTVDCHSLSEEAKSESKSKAVMSGTKRPLSPDPVQENRAMKRRDIGLVLHEAFEALQRPLNLMDASLSAPSPESSAAGSSIPENPSPSKSLLLNLRVKDYQHQTVSPSKADYLRQRSSSIQCDVELERVLPQRQPDNKLSYYQTVADQFHESQLVESVSQMNSFPRSGFLSSPGLSCKDLNPSRPDIQPAVEKDVPTSSSATVSLSSLSSLDNPSLPKSSVAFWNAMKVYCAKLDGSASRKATSTTSEKQTASARPLQPTTSSSHVEEGYPLSGANETENIMKTSRYSAHLYPDTPCGTRDIHRPIESDMASDPTRVPQGCFSYNNRDGSRLLEVFGAQTPRLPAPPSRREFRYSHIDSLPNCSFDVNKCLEDYVKVDAEPELHSGISKGGVQAVNPVSTTASIPLSRVHYIAPATAEADVPYKKPQTSVQSVRSDDIAPFDQASVTEVSAASHAGPSTLQGTGEVLVSTSTRPKLIGILKNRTEVKADSIIEWKTLQPKH